MKIIYFVVIFSLVVIAAGFYYLNAYAATLPAKIEINYCGKKQIRDYLEFRTDIITMTNQGVIDPCLIKGYIKMLNTEHKIKPLKPNPKKGKDFFKDLNNQITTRNLL